MEARQFQVTESVDLILRQLFVTVTRSGKPVRTLKKDDFRLQESGVRRELVTFSTGEVPLAAALLLDLSGSMSGARCEMALAGARAFLERLTPEDRAMVLAFSDRTLAATPFRPGRTEISARPCPNRNDGGTALNDHLYSGLRLLDGQTSHRVAVLLSDGADVSSALDIQDLLWKIERSSTVIYWIRLHDDAERFGSAWRSVEDNRRQQSLLEQAVELSGGRIVGLRDTDELGTAFDEIVEELRSQYVLGYYSETRASGVPRRVRVAVDPMLAVPGPYPLEISSVSSGTGGPERAAWIATRFLPSPFAR